MKNMPFKFTRHPENPIVWPGLYDWRRCVTFNPGVLLDDDGKFYMYERTAGQLRPFHCYIGMLESSDGVHFKHVKDTPVFTPEMAGSKYGSVQDPRVAKIDGLYYMTYAYRPYAWSSNPTGLGVPVSTEAPYPGFSGKPEENMTRSGIAVSKDRINWEHKYWATPLDLDDRDVILFPEKIGGKYWILRRPLQYVGPKYGTERAGVWVSSSTDMQNWSDATLIAKPTFSWETGRIGGSTPPIKTKHGWLVLYHGVEEEHPPTRRVIYRVGAMMLDLNDPTKVLRRTPKFIMEPETYYEKFGLYIPNVVFPTANVVKDGQIYLYYGVCDTAIALATAPLDELIAHVMSS
jgi:beta-1,2-mannobiose phosphorylase / 1,2-beta-oligomannan phosphorylase